MDLKNAIKEHGLALGLDRIGFARAEALPGDSLREWLASGCSAGMEWMAGRVEMRLDPRLMLPGARTVIVMAANYFPPGDNPGDCRMDPRLARIARYALGDDYHVVLRSRLKSLLAFIRTLAPAAEARICVDSAPIWEKEWARRAGIGWRGKHSLIIAPGLGSWITLGEIVTDLELEPDQPVPDLCGACTLCMESCPAGALTSPSTLDARRCIAYHTIESADDIPAAVRTAMGNRIFGCDICQAACPWNLKWAVPAADPSFHPRPHWQNAPLAELARWPEERFIAAAQRSPLQRRGYAGFIRSVRAAIANLQELPPLP